MVCGSHDVTLQAAVQRHQPPARRLRVDDRPRAAVAAAAGHDRALEGLVAELAAGSVGALVVAGVNPGLRAARGRGARRAPAEGAAPGELAPRTSTRRRSVSGFVCPDRHPLESWADAEPVAGVVSMTQPAVQPLGGTRQLLESIAAWSGTPRPAYDLLRDSWQSLVLPAAAGRRRDLRGVLGPRGARRLRRGGAAGDAGAGVCDRCR